MVTIHIDGRPYTIPEGQNLLQACLALGFDLPYFCWHPALGSVGACRQCAVKRFRDEKDRQGDIVMACMTPAEEGVRIAIHDPEVVRFRASVIEWLMLNHPHDCPVCDEGGECHLQDMTVMTGHTRRRTRFAKRTYHNQELGPFLNHEMNRCIQCYRCVRFYHDFAGGTDLAAMASHDHVYFGRFENGPLESPFSGNLVEICPTGVFTDKTFKDHSTRKWDLQTAPAVCVHCGLGCNIIPGERYGSLRRVRNRYHHQVNGYFLCDRGRYGYGFVNSPERLRETLQRVPGSGRVEVVSTMAALEAAAAMLADRGRVIGIGSPRSSLESNFALRTLVGPDRFHAGVSRSDFACLDAIGRVLRLGPVPAAPLQEMGMADAVLVLGEDLTQSAPLAALNLRRMRFRETAMIAAGLNVPPWNDGGVRELAQLRRPSLYLATAYPTELEDEALGTFHGSPDQLVRLAYGILSALDPDAVAMPDLDDASRSLAVDIARTLSQARHPLVVAGAGCAEPALIEAAANLAWCLNRPGRTAALTLCVPECNSLGLGLMGGLDLQSAFEAIEQGRAHTVVVLENDLYRRGQVEAVDAMLDKARHVIVIDHQHTPTAARGHLVLPAATFAECAGTLVNNEGRAQRGYAVMPCQEPVRPAWRWLGELVRTVGQNDAPGWRNLADVAADLARTLPVFRPVGDLNPRFEGPTACGKLPRQFHRYSGRTAMHANIDVSEPAPPRDEDSPLAFSMEGYDGQPPPELVSRVWAPGWNSVQALNKFQSEIGGPLRGGDPGQRLIEPVTDGPGRYFSLRASGQEPDKAQLRLVPIHHIFGSEELSLAAPAIAQRAPQPYLALNPDDAPAGEAQRLRLLVNGRSLELPVKLLAGLPRGVAGWPVGLTGLPTIDLPATVSILGVSDAGQVHGARDEG